MMLCNYLILNTCENSKLTLDCYIKLVCILNDFLCKSHVLIIWKVRTVDHN